MPLANYVTYSSQASTNPVKLALENPIACNTLYLYEYNIQGIPVTAGEPDHTHYLLQLDGSNLHQFNWVNSGLLTGIPIQLNGQTTHEDKTPPVLIGDVHGGILNEITFRFLNPDGTLATLSKFCIVFKTERE